MAGLNVNAIAWVIVNGTTRVNQPMNSFIVFHQALSDGTDKKISPQLIYSTLESNKKCGIIYDISLVLTYYS